MFSNYKKIVVHGFVSRIVHHLVLVMYLFPCAVDIASIDDQGTWSRVHAAPCFLLHTTLVLASVEQLAGEGQVSL